MALLRIGRTTLLAATLLVGMLRVQALHFEPQQWKELEDGEPCVKDYYNCPSALQFEIAGPPVQPPPEVPAAAEPEKPPPPKEFTPKTCSRKDFVDDDATRGCPSKLGSSVKKKFDNFSPETRVYIFSGTKNYFPQVQLYEYNAKGSTQQEKYREMQPIGAHEEGEYKFEQGKEYIVEVGTGTGFSTHGYPPVPTGEFYLYLSKGGPSVFTVGKDITVDSVIKSSGGSKMPAKVNFGPFFRLVKSVGSTQYHVGSLNTRLTPLYTPSEKSIMFYYNEGADTYCGTGNKRRVTVKVFGKSGDCLGTEPGSCTYEITCNTPKFEAFINGLAASIQ